MSNLSGDTTPKAVLVPVLLTVYKNYGEYVPKNKPNEAAYLLPIPRPNLKALQVGDGLVQHDIFEHHRSPPYMAWADRTRLQDNRVGMYLHWSLPEHYRTGLAGSGSTKDVIEEQKVRGGFVMTPEQSSNISNPVFRQVPTRWIIFRKIRAGPEGLIRLQRWESPEKYVPPPQTYDYIDNSDTVYPATTEVNTTFVVESNVVRDIRYMDDVLDLENTTTPHYDPDVEMSRQDQRFLGRASNMDTWTEGRVAGYSRSTREISLTASSNINPYFADFQPQNSSVFSFFDDLSYLCKQGTFKDIRYRYVDCNVTYTVVGYHGDVKMDPLNVSLSGQISRRDRLEACLMTANPEKLRPTDTTWLDGISSNGAAWSPQMRTICHGNLYDIQWTRAGSSIADPMKNLADDIQSAFTSVHPLAVGTNPMDAMLAWLRAIPPNMLDGATTVAEMQQNLLKLQTLILDVNDDIDSQLQAQDLLSLNNFMPSPQGKKFFFQLEDAPAADGTNMFLKEQVSYLTALNQRQARLNALKRLESRYARDFFAIWWRRAALDIALTKGEQDNQIKSMRDAVNPMRQKLQIVTNLIRQLTYDVEAITKSASASLIVQEGIEPNFYMQRDPTIFVAGLNSRWPNKDAQDMLTIRLDTQVAYATTPNVANSLAPALSKLPTDVKAVAACLLQEAAVRDPRSNGGQPQDPAPQYFKNGDRYTGENGWFPLFIEYEVEYYHIPFSAWKWGEYGPEKRVGYALDDNFDITTTSIKNDYRILKGRAPILPNAATMLQATLKQAFSKAEPSELQLTATQQADLLTDILKLDFLSATMTGFTDQLVTRLKEPHVTPWNYKNADFPDVTPEASQLGQSIGMRKEDFTMIGQEVTYTPFANLIPIPTASTSNPFKPVTHGQFRFTKFNIIDRFGQMVSGMRTTANPLGYLTTAAGPSTSPLQPCLGEAYSVQALNDNSGRAKVVLPRNDSICPFVQIPPCINQDARINCDFLTEVDPDASKRQWRVAEPGENPVKGWILANFANTSVQIFSPDGQFIREYSVVNEQPTVRPFGQSGSLFQRQDSLLKDFVANFVKPGYLATIYNTLADAVMSVQSSPSHYAGSIPSTFGKPLALVAFGTSLQLAEPPLVNQYSPLSDRVRASSVLDYQFKLKIGDKDNVFDGIYGYFAQSQNPDQDFNFDTFYSYHSDTNRPIDVNVTPFYADPTEGEGDVVAIASSKLTKFAALMDPFTAIHIYSAILPIKQLYLPPWALDYGINRITSFFRIGPILSADDVPKYKPGMRVAQDYRLGDQNAPKATGSVEVPAVKLGDWAWLQPYIDDRGSTGYNVMEVRPGPTSPEWKPGPYVAVEGYLQMQRPFSNPATVPSVTPSKNTY